MREHAGVRGWLGSRELERDRTVLAAALLLFAVMAMFKLLLLAWLIRAGQTALPRPLPFAALLFGPDAIVAAIYAALCAPLIALRRPFCVGALLLLHALSVGLLGISLRVNQLYGQPVNVRMFQYAADGAVRSCVAASVDATFIIAMIVGISAFALVPAVARRLDSRRLPERRWTLWGTSFALAAGAMAVTGVAFRGLEFNLGLKSNPLMYFARSYQPLPKPADFRRELQAAQANGELDRASIFELASTRPSRFPAAGIEGAAKDMNLLVVLLESTPAVAVNETLTPNLIALERESTRFTHHFTTAPFTFDAQYALFYSDLSRGSQVPYPELYSGPPRDASLMEAFKAAGRSTAVFESSYLSLLNMNWLFEQKGVDELHGAEQVLAGLKPGWAWGAFENDSVDAVASWIRAHRDRPFVAVYNPVSPHYPYGWPLDARAFPGDTHEDDYRNALHFTDAQIGRLLKELDRLGLSAHTAVVVVSDHGESIGRGHGFAFVADELWVPFFVRVPGRAPRTIDAVTSHLDFAPTIAGLFGLPQSPTWLGRDLAADQAPARLSLMGSVFGERVGLVDGSYAYCEETGRAPAAFRVTPLKFEPLEASQLPPGVSAHFHEALADLDHRIRIRHYSLALANR
ncbi:MAG: sulfatase-like hydrolase/transferase [Deltaproteobacteria bacterium]|nr:sulfatase-like hydrolase/transferase [Deltaproteobacteria bacterium]